jgi:hypothetical protein
VLVDVFEFPCAGGTLPERTIHQQMDTFGDHCVLNRSSFGSAASEESEATDASTQAMSELNVFGFTVPGVLKDVAATSVPRPTDVLEVWSGVFSVGRGAEVEGFSAVPFDRDREPGKTDVPGCKSEDLLTKDGFHHVVMETLQLKAGGLLMMAPVCSSMGWPNSSRCKRTDDNPEGDLTYIPVQDGNTFAKVCDFLLQIGVARSVFIIIENPPNSWLWKLLQPTLSTCPSVSEVIVPRCAYSDELPGKRFLKPYKFVAVSSQLGGSLRINHLRGVCGCPFESSASGARMHEPLMKGPTWSRRGIKANLHAAQKYPDRLGRALVLAWQGKSSPHLENQVAARPVSEGSQVSNVRPARRRRVARLGSQESDGAVQVSDRHVRRRAARPKSESEVSQVSEDEVEVYELEPDTAGGMPERSDQVEGSFFEPESDASDHESDGKHGADSATFEPTE